jgi:CheY-like chemotaxis protein
MPINVVIVDDNECDRYLTKRALMAYGVAHHVIECSDGDEFKNLVMDQKQFGDTCGPHPPPSLILLDINMPRMSGFELLEELEEHGENLNLYNCCVFMMHTSSENPMDIQRAEEFYCVKGYLVKPINKEKLQRILEAHYPDFRQDNAEVL